MTNPYEGFVPFDPFRSIERRAWQEGFDAADELGRLAVQLGLTAETLEQAARNHFALYPKLVRFGRDLGYDIYPRN